jgi:hypothetical protein
MELAITKKKISPRNPLIMSSSKATPTKGVHSSGKPYTAYGPHAQDLAVELD